MPFSGATFKRRGFTLVELLIVVGIIALLIGLLLPALNKSREQAKQTTCLANLRSLGQSLFVYANSNRDRLPNHNPPLDWVSYAGSNSAMISFYKYYVKSPGVFWCPSDINNTIPTDITSADQTFPNSARVSYEFFSLWFAPEYGPLLTRLHGKAPLAWDVEGGATTGPSRNHKGGGNVVFADGHAEFWPYKMWQFSSWPYPAATYYP